MLDVITSLLNACDFVPIITGQQALEFDRYTMDDLGIRSAHLMESAGAGVARAVVAQLRNRKTAAIFVFVGPGNNGADAIVASRYLLAHGLKFQIFFMTEEDRFSRDLQYQLSLLRAALRHLNQDERDWFFHSLPTVAHAVRDVLFVDGIFGAGINRAPTGRPLLAIQFINNFRATHPQQSFVVSIDIPSGLSLEAATIDYPHIIADACITFGYKKRAHISEPTKVSCGTTSAVNIGLFANSPITTFYRHRRQALLSLFKPLMPTSHKGQFGHVLVFEGHPHYRGATRLSARGALRAGAGMVSIATINPFLSSTSDMPELMHIKRKDLSNDFMKRIDAVVIGPGLSKEVSLQTQAMEFIHRWQRLLSLVVLDADGLHLFSNREIDNVQSTIIATPHPKEAGDILGVTAASIESDRFCAIDQLANVSDKKNLKVIWVLKGATTLVRALTGEVFAFRGELPILSAGGSGDVLSGAIAGCTKQTNSPLEAALLAVSLQIASAAMVSQRVSKGSFASELADTFLLVTKHRPIG